MSKLLQEEYFHFGNDNIYKELWLNIQMQHNFSNYSKPIGGLWTSKVNNHSICDWLGYMENKDAYNFDIYVGNKKSSLIKFKEDAKLLSIEDSNDLKNLKDSGFIIKLDEPIKLNYPYRIIIDELPDYDKISEHYDLMYVRYFVDECFRQFSVDTMLAINPDAIEYYRSLSANYIYHTIDSVSDKKFISEPNKEYYDFLMYVRSLFYEIEADNYNDFLVKLYKLKNIIIEDLKKNFDVSKLNLPENIKPEHVIKTVANNVYREKYFARRKILK